MQSFISDDGARIAYRDSVTDGDTDGGQPLLCLAGLTRSSTDFDYLAPHLPGVRMICMDYRGRGQSDWTGADSYSVAREARDAVLLLDHLGLERVPILGTSRGGLIGMALGASLPQRVAGLCLNDIGPVIEHAGLERIKDYIGRSPMAASHAELAAKLPGLMQGFANVPPDRWLDEARRHYAMTPEGLRITYDPALATAFIAAYGAETPDMWPLFEALADMPVALIHAANSDLLSRATVAEMRRRHPGLIHGDVADRAHIPFLDEPESLTVIRAFLAACA